MKQGKQLTTGRRILYFVGLVLMIEVVLFVAGVFSGFFEAAGFNQTPFYLLLEQAWD